MSELSPLVFTAMPFGKRKNPNSGYSIDFDYIYQNAIVPAIKTVGFDGIRGDEEATGGIIMKAVFERLLLAEIVIADLTIQNPNVLYEVGVRHCAKPRSTIIIFADTAPLPFDISLVRGIPYTLEKGILTDKASEALQIELIKRLTATTDSSISPDSPLTQLFHKFPHADYVHLDIDNFEERARGISSFQNAISDAVATQDRATAIEILGNIERKAPQPSDMNQSIYIALMFAYRKRESWEDMIRISELLLAYNPNQIPIIIQQRGLALNRRNEGVDRDTAERELIELLKVPGDTSETCGILGRIYKDRYQDAVGFNVERQNYGDIFTELRAGNAQALGYLQKSIEWYERGFLHDPCDYYPGINEATLRFVRWRTEDQQKLKILLPTVLFSVGRLSSDDFPDYWLIATELELQVLNEDWELADRSVERMMALDPGEMELNTTANNIRLIREALRVREGDFSRLDAILVNFP